MAIDLSQRQKQLRRALNGLYVRQSYAIESPAPVQRQIKEQINMILGDLRTMKGPERAARPPRVKTSPRRVIVNFCLGCNKPIERGQQAVKYADYGLCCNFSCLLQIMDRVSEDKKRKSSQPL